MEIKQSIQEQTPATKNQITSNKPDVIKNSNLLQGYIANSLNGGIIKPIAYKRVLAGEKISEMSLNMCIRMLTPKTPAYQKLKGTLKAYFVPDTRVWENAEKFESQRGGASETKIEEIPNTDGLTLPFANGIVLDGSSVLEKLAPECLITSTDIFRDSYMSTYLPRYNGDSFRAKHYFDEEDGQEKTDVTKKYTDRLPKISILKMRGIKAIYNDFERNKEYDTPLKEYKSDHVSDAEWGSYFWWSDVKQNEHNLAKNLNEIILRGKRQNSYYTDYRTELLGDEIDAPADFDTNLVSAVEWQKKVAEARSEAENAQLNDWDIISKIRGSKPLTENKVLLLGKQTFGLNYEQVTQDTYNVNEKITEEFQQLGQQGAYSYTEINVPIVNMFEAKQTGYIHVIMQVSADTVFETGIDRIELNVGKYDQYRPDLKDLKNDVLYSIEKGTYNISPEMFENEIKAIDGYKRKYSEYFKLPNIVAGDMTTLNYAQTEYKQLYEGEDSQGNKQGAYVLVVDNNKQVETQKTFTFFEESDIDTTYTELKKNKWQDYTDLLINKNQAVQNEVEQFLENTGKSFIRVKGQNQIFFVGIVNCITMQPIDEEIRNNYTKWGEM